MSTRIPSSWVESTFSELNQFESRTTDPAQHPQEEFELYSVPIFPTGKPELLKGAAIGSTKQTVEPNDVLVCKINPRINRVWQVGDKRKYRQIASSEWIGFRSEVLNLKFYKYYLTSARFRELICTDLTGVGGSLTRAQPKRVATFPMPVAPFNEQKRIADKLDAVLARVDACRDRLDHIPTILKRFRQSALAAATSGKLTEEWREELIFSVTPDQVVAERRLCAKKVSEQKALESFLAAFATDSGDIHGLPKSWVVTNVGSIGIVSNGSTPSRQNKSYWGGDIAWVSSGEVRNREISSTRERITSEGYENASVRMLPKGTVLIAMIGEGKTRGQSALLVIMACTNQNIAGVVPVESLIDSKYLWYWFQAQYENNRVVGSGTGPQALNCQRVRELPVNLPPLQEQAEIVRRVETLFAYADRIESRYTAARAQVEKLTPATLAKAFRGELVPQDPQDEPASELLERIKANHGGKVESNPKRARSLGRS